jgi:hypothetical protein
MAGGTMAVQPKMYSRALFEGWREYRPGRRTWSVTSVGSVVVNDNYFSLGNSNCHCSAWSVWGAGDCLQRRLETGRLGETYPTKGRG